MPVERGRVRGVRGAGGPGGARVRVVFARDFGGRGVFIGRGS